MKTMRKLHITHNNKEEIWHYLIGRSTVTIKWPNNNKKIYVKFDKIMDMTIYEVERGIYKGWLHVVPSDVKHYIETKLL